MKIDITKPLKTRGGNSVVILTDSSRGLYPIVGHIGDSRHLDMWTAEGKFQAGDGAPDTNDLVYALPKTEAWFNCYADGRMIRYDNKEDADVSAKPSRIARIKVQYEPGQFD